MNEEIFKYDHKEIYCRKLGHFLKLAYCRVEYDGKLCKRFDECWRGKIPISLLLSKSYVSVPQKIDRQVAPDKLALILGIVAGINSEHSEKNN